jgi:aminoglycoside 3-N-acetyltransferase I
MAEFEIVRIGGSQLAEARALNAMFSDAFEEPEQYRDHAPPDSWLMARLVDPNMISLVALDDGSVIGGLTAYILPKLEQQRSEIYIYDIAVAETHRRRGIATALIGFLQDNAQSLGAGVIFIQAHIEDDAPVALYTKLGRREDVLHFDIKPR